MSKIKGKWVHVAGVDWHTEIHFLKYIPSWNYFNFRKSKSVAFVNFKIYNKMFINFSHVICLGLPFYAHIVIEPYVSKCYSLTHFLIYLIQIVHIKGSENIVGSTYFLYWAWYFNFTFATHCQVVFEQGDNTRQ